MSGAAHCGMRLALLVVLFSACVDAASDEDLGNIGDGKSDSFGIVDKQSRSRPVIIGGSRSRRTPRSGSLSPSRDRSAARPDLTLALKDPTARLGGRRRARARDGGRGRARRGRQLQPHDQERRHDDGERGAQRPRDGELRRPARSQRGDLSRCNLAAADHRQVPGTYVIFNNTGCSHDCTLVDQSALAPRSVMIKLLSRAIHEVKDGGTVRVSNFNISPSQTAGIVVDALVWAMTERTRRSRS